MNNNCRSDQVVRKISPKEKGRSSFSYKWHKRRKSSFRMSTYVYQLIIILAMIALTPTESSTFYVNEVFSDVVPLNMINSTASFETKTLTYGIIFVLEMKHPNSNIIIQSVDIHTSATSALGLEIWSMKGSYKDRNHFDRNEWSKSCCDSPVIGKGRGKVTPISSTLFKPIVLEHNSNEYESGITELSLIIRLESPQLISTFVKKERDDKNIFTPKRNEPYMTVKPGAEFDAETFDRGLFNQEQLLWNGIINYNASIIKNKEINQEAERSKQDEKRKRIYPQIQFDQNRRNMLTSYHKNRNSDVEVSFDTVENTMPCFYNGYILTPVLPSVKSNGVMFDLVTSRNLILDFIEFPCVKAKGTEVNYHMYAKLGSHTSDNKNEHISWTAVSEGILISGGTEGMTRIPKKQFSRVLMEANQTYALYITLDIDDLLSAPGSELGQAYTEDENLSLLQGVAYTGDIPFESETILYPRLFQGKLYYTIEEECPDGFQPPNDESPPELMRLHSKEQPSPGPTFLSMIPSPKPSSFATHLNTVKQDAFLPSRHLSSSPTFLNRVISSSNFSTTNTTTIQQSFSSYTNSSNQLNNSSLTTEQVLRSITNSSNQLNNSSLTTEQVWSSITNSSNELNSSAPVIPPMNIPNSTFKPIVIQTNSSTEILSPGTNSSIEEINPERNMTSFNEVEQGSKNATGNGDESVENVKNEAEIFKNQTEHEHRNFTRVTFKFLITEYASFDLDLKFDNIMEDLERSVDESIRDLLMSEPLLTMYSEEYDLSLESLTKNIYDPQDDALAFHCATVTNSTSCSIVEIIANMSNINASISDMVRFIFLSEADRIVTEFTYSILDDFTYINLIKYIGPRTEQTFVDVQLKGSNFTLEWVENEKIVIIENTFRSTAQRELSSNDLFSDARVIDVKVTDQDDLNGEIEQNSRRVLTDESNPPQYDARKQRIHESEFESLKMSLQFKSEYQANSLIKSFDDVILEELQGAIKDILVNLTSHEGFGWIRALEVKKNEDGDGHAPVSTDTNPASDSGFSLSWNLRMILYVVLPTVASSAIICAFFLRSKNEPPEKGQSNSRRNNFSAKRLSDIWCRDDFDNNFQRSSLRMIFRRDSLGARRSSISIND